MTTPTPERSEYLERGHCGPFPLLSPAQARAAMAEVAAGAARVPGLLDRPRGSRYWDGLGRTFAWYKSLHAHVESAARIARHPDLLSRVAAILGPELCLWGVELLRKPAGEAHRWHVDVECESHGATVWLALENVGPASGIKLLDRSHRFEASPQELGASSGLDLHDDEAVLSAARARDPRAVITAPQVAPGQFVIFPGRLWHASFNATPAPRTVLILQYSPAGSAVRIPARIGPPVVWHQARPPVLELSYSGC